MFAFIKLFVSAIKRKIRFRLEKNIPIAEERPLIQPIKNSPGKYIFYCPGCNDYHVVIVGKKSYNHALTGSLTNPTVRASILSKPDFHHPQKPRCHSFITNGKIEFLNDSTHHLAGMTVPLQPM